MTDTTGAFAPWVVHGRPQVAADGHHLEYADGSDCFLLGDTAWHLARLTPSDLERYLAHRRAAGFNLILFQIGLQANPNYAGEVAFVGVGPPWATMQPNVAAFAHIDHIVARARAHGLFLGVLPWWGNHATGPRQPFFAHPERDNEAYGRFLGARYGAEPHIIWVVSGEYDSGSRVPPLPERDRRLLVRVAEGIRAGAAAGGHARQLMTIHPLGLRSSSEHFHAASWLDFHMIQSHVWQDAIVPLVSHDWLLMPPRPTLLAEGWYEGEEALFEEREQITTTTRYDPGWIQRYQAYWAIFHGSFGYVYGHRRLWTMTAPDEPWPASSAHVPGTLHQDALDAPGVVGLRHARALIERFPGRSRVPDQALVSTNTRGRCAGLRPNLVCALRDRDRGWALAYSTRGEVMCLAMDQLASDLVDAAWYNPRTGRWHANGVETTVVRPAEQAIPAGPGAPARHFHPPGGPADGNDWVLLLQRPRLGLGDGQATPAAPARGEPPD